jgi:putative copper export protein
MVSAVSAGTGLAPALDAVRLSLHVLAAAVWVGGQVTLAGLVPTARSLAKDAPRRLAHAFARLSWPAFVLLLGTGVWNVVAVAKGQGALWQAVLGAKIFVAVASGVAAWRHSHARRREAIAAWGAMSGVTAVTALVLGVVLAG